MTIAYARFASWCAYLAALGGLAYSIVFVVTRDDDTRFGEGLEGALLLAGGVVAIAVGAGLYERVREREPGFALLALLFATAGGLGAAIHGAHELALAVGDDEALDLPNAVDPRGFLTFGVTAVAVAIFAFLLEGRLRTIGVVLAVLLAILWIGRFVGGDADDVLLLIPAVLAGLVVNPLWYFAVGRELGGGIVSD